MGKQELDALMPQWKVLEQMDGELSEIISKWRGNLFSAKNLEPKYKEIIMVCMNCIHCFEAGIELHMLRAIEQGATKEEIFDALTLTLLNGGFPSFRAGVYVFDSVFGVTKE